MPSFGEKLKQEREKRKITLEQISVTTKIGTRMLQALEEDKFNQLPGGIFNKGFVRAYSRCVGLDEDQTVADYLLASGDAPPVPTEIAPRDDSARENAERISRLEASNEATPKPLPWGMFAAVLLVIALVLSFWNHRRQEGERKSARLAQAANAGKSPPSAGPAESSIPAENSNTNSGSAESGNAEGRNAQGQNTDQSRPPTTPSAAGSNAAVATPGPSSAVSTPSPSPSSSTASSTAVSAAKTQGEFQVVVRTREESWIRATVDGKSDPSETLPQDTERVFRGRKQIILKVGNAGGVDLSVNGKKIAISGESGEVKTITLGPEGIIPNIPESVPNL